MIKLLMKIGRRITPIRNQRVFFLLFISCIGGILLFFACKYTYESKLSKLKQQAKKNIIEAVNQEVKNRGLSEALISTLDAPDFVVASKVPDSVCIVNASGKSWFRFDPKKDSLNITHVTKIRLLHSYALEKYPLIPDSLNAIWTKYLLKSHISLKSALRISVTDGKGTVVTKNTLQDCLCIPSNLMFKISIGYASEIEVMGYLKYSMWSIIRLEVLLFLLLYVAGVYGAYNISICIRKRIKTMRQQEKAQMPVTIEAIEVNSTPIHTFILHENLIFYAEQNKMKKYGVIKKMPAQASRLLKLFLLNKEEDYILRDDVIIKNLWPDGSGNMYRVHKAITRLRTIIHEYDDTIEIKRGTETYQLIL